MQLAISEQSPLQYNPGLDLFTGQTSVRGVTLTSGGESLDAHNLDRELSRIVDNADRTIIQNDTELEKAHAARALKLQLTSTLGQLGVGDEVKFTLLNPDAYPYLKAGADDIKKDKLEFALGFLSGVVGPHQTATNVLTEAVLASYLGCEKGTKNLIDYNPTFESKYKSIIKPIKESNYRLESIEIINIRKKNNFHKPTNHKF